VDVKGDLRNEYNADASRWHDLPDEATALYISDLRDAVGDGEGRLALDVGTGTGMLTGVLLKSGFRVSGVDFAAEMLAVAKRSFPSVQFKLVDDIERAPDCYPPESFDLIICRQVVGHFTNPIATFRQWAGWLKQSGQVAVIDALWPRSAWTGMCPDHLPLACTQTWATVAYMLEQAGLTVTERRWLHRVNGYEAVRALSTNTPPVVRYVVVGRGS